MSREHRIQYENAWYHVMNRAAGKKFIFKDENNKYIFMELLKDIHDKYAVQIHSFCIMDNHYHLLLRTPKANLSKAIHSLQFRYSSTYNKIINSDGPVFRNRFKSILINNDSYLLQICRYIHLNPIEAKIAKINEYKWSSYNYYISSLNKPIWLYTDFLKNMFGVDNNNYINFHRNDRDYNYLLNDFYKKIYKKTVVNNIDSDINLQDLEELIKQMFPNEFNCNKLLFCLIAKYIYKYKIREIAEYLKCKSINGISSLIFRHKNKINKGLLEDLVKTKHTPKMLITEFYKILKDTK